jgi:hypothetical protein
VYRLTEAGAAALLAGLERGDWSTQRSRPAFVTWLALSPLAPRPTIEAVIARRAAFLREQIGREREHLETVGREAGPAGRVAELMVRFTLSQFEAELLWLEEVAHTLLDDSPPA